MSYVDITILSILATLYFSVEITILFYYGKISFGYDSNGFDFEELAKKHDIPFVSIIVPAYNEENNIGKCLKSLKSLNYPHYEIILIDGGSTDKTVSVAQEYLEPKNIIVSEGLPEGWIGKSWACHLGYQAAKGDILLFTDADTEHKPESLRKLVCISRETNAGLLTLLPYQKMSKYWESILPIYYFMSHVSSGGSKRVNNRENQDSFLASGQYMLFTRKAYVEFGGHESIKGSVVEDYAIARCIKTKLNCLYYLENHQLVASRMYPDSPRMCWTGIKKVLYAGTRITSPKKIILSTLFVLWVILTPFAILLSVRHETRLFFLITSGIYILHLLVFAHYWNKKGRHYYLTYLLLPFLEFVFILAMIFSVLEIKFKKTTEWKGIKYTPDLDAGLS
ncbi:MAG: glycosyltransferase [Promethearchaeota archaeon]|nr:MAG: glycosyltransferase [Candidatus Lokiarchaeota archaeon]